MTTQNPNDQSAPPADEPVEYLYTAAEAEEIAARRVAEDRQARHRRQQQQQQRPGVSTVQRTSAAAQSADPMAAIGQLVQLKIAEALGVLNPGSNAPQNAHPVSDRGSPTVPRVALDEQNLLTMTPSDREALVRQKGNAWFSDQLHKQLRDGNVRFKVK